ncbi:hypothetical protein SAMN02745215_04275 [Desulfitobacterium chlororespirans DSM 11544]|uniref:Uncharacterized protein n=1 Tax=Desulfitobacterium chlororespirans DSM 11544 TaxID=1121395 RepID=A0A1M7UPE4_9FIRM|nr:hypothetical protein SAMN02745215_04275 [Desulfitobacterium chlororespirans DSM 11544]
MTQSPLLQHGEIPYKFPLHKLSLQTLPMNTVGIHISGEIIVNDRHNKNPQFAYYLALLAEASKLNTDRIFEVDSNGDLIARIIRCTT